MDTYSIILFLLNVLVGALLLMATRPLMAGSTAPNPWFGFRLDRSKLSEEKWMKVNQAGGRKVRAWACIIVAVGVVALFTTFDGRTGTAVVFAMAPLVILIPLAQTWFYARTL